MFFYNSNLSRFKDNDFENLKFWSKIGSARSNYHTLCSLMYSQNTRNELLWSELAKINICKLFFLGQYLNPIIFFS
jgi:hypothetical protein